MLFGWRDRDVRALRRVPGRHLSVDRGPLIFGARARESCTPRSGGIPKLGLHRHAAFKRASGEGTGGSQGPLIPYPHPSLEHISEDIGRSTMRSIAAGR